jgi:16S rRNA (guanine527-N7)-methyltransferase
LIAREPAAAATDGELADLLAEGADALALALTPAQIDLFVAYVRLIAHWNGAYNLTAVRDPRAMVFQHILDCLAVIVPLRRRGLARAGARLLDVGSGAGLPGLVIAAAEPALNVVCVDSVGKKAAFITHAVAALGLKNATALHGRVEAVAEAGFDVVTSRAFASLADFFSTTRSLLAEQGGWMAMKGKVPHDELALLQNVAFHVEPLVVPGLAADRCVIWAHPSK